MPAHPLRTARAAAALALLVAAAPAAAQDVDTFEAAGGAFDRRGTLQLESPLLGLNGAWYANTSFMYANKPLVYLRDDGVEEVVVSSMSALGLHGGYTIGGRARIDLLVPYYVASVVEPDTVRALGDIRLSSTISLATLADGAFAVGIVPQIWLPTGNAAALVTPGGLSGGGLVALGGQAGDLGWTANVGVRGAAPGELQAGGQDGGSLDLGSDLAFGAGASYRVAEPALLGVEIDGRAPFSDNINGNQLSAVESHYFGSFGKEGGFQATVGLGHTLVAGAGAPVFRGFVSLGYRDPGAPPDRDQDGLVDREDACPDDPEDMDGWKDQDGCPDPDNDADGVPDKRDQCPDSPEDVDTWQDEDGCPDNDNDGDTVPDAQDACPLVAGNPAAEGCPDRDGDGFLDDVDRCPLESAPRPSSADGCPVRVVVEQKQIVILEKVFFDLDSAVIQARSFPVLDEVARVLRENPQIKKVEIAGHTDNQGSAVRNRRLGQSRAEAVRDYLVGKGVAADRLLPKGYGSDRLIDLARTEDAHAKNRRVEFLILETDAPAQ